MAANMHDAATSPVHVDVLVLGHRSHTTECLAEPAPAVQKLKLKLSKKVKRPASFQSISNVAVKHVPGWDQSSSTPSMAAAAGGA